TSDIAQHQFKAVATGSVVNNLKSETVKAIKFALPPLAVQRKIVSTLVLSDGKIKSNEAINENLTKQIRALCNAWLNDYVPFDFICPNDWEPTSLSAFARFISGYSYKGNELQESSVAMATIKNFDRKGGFKLDGYKEIVPSSKLKPEHNAELYDTLVAHTDLTQNAEVIGNAEPILSFSGYENIIFSMDVVKVVPNNPAISKFLIAAILQTQRFKEHCLGYVNGTTVLHLSKKALPDYVLMLPKDISVLKPLDEALSSMYQQMALNIDENVHLTKVRDSLLPRLMSGELDVSDLDV
ncbi:MAG: restriction endonuclease subunit S, partial [Thermoguttaceae bacterium]|nr:restriction endonuclease subunit S [Thermoguttaceae bacterium]